MFALVPTVALGLQWYTPLRALSHGPLFWLGMGIWVCFVGDLLRIEWIYHVLRPLFVLWRVWYCCGPLSQVYGWKSALSSVKARPADLLDGNFFDRFRRSPLHMLCYLFLENCVRGLKVLYSELRVCDVGAPLLVMLLVVGIAHVECRGGRGTGSTRVEYSYRARGVRGSHRPG